MLNKVNTSVQTLNQPKISPLNPYKWKEYKMDLFNTLLSNTILSYFIQIFYRDVIQGSSIQYNDYAIILKIKFTDSSIRSISKLLLINNTTPLEEVKDILVMFWNLRSEYYHLKDVEEIFILYKMLSNTKHPKLSSNIKKINSLIGINRETMKEYNYDGYQLPNNTNILNWGKLLQEDSNNSILIESNLKFGKQILFYNVFKYTDHNLVQVFLNKNILFTFKDIFIDGEFTFKRILQNNEFNYVNGIMTTKKVERKVQYLKPISKNLYRSDLFLTLDIETKTVRGQLQPICISIYDGFIVRSFFIKDFKSEIDMFSAAFDSIKARKYNYQKIYIHNLSYFDGVFLLKNLSEIGKIKPLMRNGQIYNIRLELLGDRNQKYVFYLRDSLLILPHSLDKLAKSFNVSNKKVIFPIFSVNNYPLDYIGDVPEIKNFKNQSDYFNYKLKFKGNWDLKKELINYCENDTIALHQVMQYFSKEVFKLFRVDITKYMTLSSISFAIFRSNFLKEWNIPKINGQMFEDIYKSYKGGLVDMYKPEGSNLFLHDVNSEYPEAMCRDLPGGKVSYVEGPLDLNDEQNFGFFKADIISNPKLNMPVLPVKYNNTTLTPLGSWTDWYFSEELKEAQNKYGYKIKIVKGYVFERVKIFPEFVNFLYSIKEKTSKYDPFYLIIKLLLNMLYGRFGMKPEKEENIIVKNKEAEEYYKNQDIIINDIMDLGNGKELLKFIQKSHYIENDFLNPNISIAIASAVVAYGRIKINTLKHLDNIQVYYSDTDSLVVNKQLPEQYIGTKLGQLKVEDKIRWGYFLAPKVYGFVDNNNKFTVKIKGLKTPFSFFELNQLLYKNTSLIKYQEKWYRN